MIGKIRMLHLLAGLVIIPFLAIYAFSSVYMVHTGLDKSGGHKTVTDLRLGSVPGSRDELLSMLADEHGVSGNQASGDWGQDGAVSLKIKRPGTQFVIKGDLRSGTLQLTIVRSNAMRFLKELHKTAGLEGNHAGSRAWGIYVLAQSVVLLVIGLSGLYLWLRRSRERRAGTIFLAGSLVFAVTVLTVVRLG